MAAKGMLWSKKAMASSLYVFEKENMKLPEVGEYSIFTNG